MAERENPIVALTLGDPAGIGPEIVFKALADERVRDSLRLILIGPRGLRPAYVAEIDANREALPFDKDVAWHSIDGPSDWTVGQASRVGGRYALDALAVGAQLARSGRAAALVTAPVCKAALHLAGEGVEGQTELLSRWDERECWMVAVAGNVRALLLTRHMPLRAALDALTPELVERGVRAMHAALALMGHASGRIALAGVNPHAGEGGLLGVEEDELLEPALARLRADGINVAGPVSPDAVFLAAQGGDYDGVVALYHDQAFIPIKLLSQQRGLTVLAGLSYLRVSPVHGTAFDIAGRGVANPENLIHALVTAGTWAGAPASC